MPEDKDILEEIAEELEKEAFDLIDAQLASGSGEEEDTEKAKATVKDVIAYCTEQALQYAKTPEEFEREFNECINEWYSTVLIISKKALRKVRSQMKRGAK